MPNYIRSWVPGGTYFFTVTLKDRSSNLLVDRIEALRASFRYVHERHPFRIDAIVVLPNHLHAMWTLPTDDANYAMRWGFIKQVFTKKVEVFGWQKRYWEHQIRDEEDFERHVEYIHFNPVKHGHAERVQDWRYSSFHRFVRAGMLPREWGLVSAIDGRFGE